MLKLIEAHGYSVDTMRLQVGDGFYSLHMLGDRIHVICCVEGLDGHFHAEDVTTVNSFETAHQAVLAYAAERAAANACTEVV